MRTRMLAVIAAVGSLFTLEGCSEVESCKQYAPGCLDGPPDDSGNCRFGLVIGPASVCVEDDCGCGAGQLCGGGSSCIDICAPAELPTSRPVGFECRPDATEGEAAYDFASAAQALCSQECVRRAELCHSTCDPMTECGPVVAMTFATRFCTPPDVECVMARCEQVSQPPCAQQMCPANAAPDCANVTCTNTCASNNPLFVFDGLCDDGDLSNATSSACDWGTDCGDCGPRRGSAPPAKRGLGEPCVDPFQCGADMVDYSRSTAWCVNLDSGQRCVPDCTTNDNCPDGFMCDSLVYEGDDGTTRPVMDEFGNTASACFPLMC